MASLISDDESDVSSLASEQVRMDELKLKISAGVQTVKKVLHANRNPKFADQVQHKYRDKYFLAEALTGAACASTASVLELLGLSSKGFATLVEWAAEKSVTLSLRSTETCAFVKKANRDVESSTKHTREVKKSGIMGTSSSTTTHKVITTITEYFWTRTVRYELFAFEGTDLASRVVFRQREGSATHVTTSDSTPFPKSRDVYPVELNLSWFLKVASPGNVAFSIDRSHKDCHTPRRNVDVEAALDFFSRLVTWCHRLTGYFGGLLFSHPDAKAFYAGVADAAGVFVPVLPLMEKKPKATPTAVAPSILLEPSKELALATAEDSGAVAALPPSDLHAFLAEGRRSLEAKLADVTKVLPVAKAHYWTDQEGHVAALGFYALRVAEQYEESLEFIEDMLRAQLVKAIGKKVTSSDFSEYMRFHNRKLFLEEYQPRGFAYAIRREGHNPEGTVILEERATSDSTPVAAMSRCVDTGGKMRFPLNASTDMSFAGKTYLHCSLGHRFSTEPVPSLALRARAGQFSGFVMMVGTVGGKDLFLPKAAMIVRNKDDFTLNLQLAEIPTAKEFKKAVNSLSPEQQRFAKAYRSMQMEATLFGVCVVQIKPQLEKVLNLPADALTKELELTQELTRLFVEYQIPADLLSYQVDGLEDPDCVSVPVKLAQVKEHVAAVLQMLEQSKRDEIAEQQRVLQLQKLEAQRAKPDKKLQRPTKANEYLDMFKYRARVEECDGCYDGEEDDDFEEEMGEGECWGGECCDDELLCLEEEECCEPACFDEDFEAPDQKNDAEPEPAEQKEEAPTKKPVQEETFDLSTFPHELEAAFEESDEAACVRPTIITVASPWYKKYQRGLLSPTESTVLYSDQQKKEKDRAYDLLDALTRSGVLDLEEAELHVVVAMTHCFDKTLFETVIQQNVNPIEEVERTAVRIASVLHRAAPTSLVKKSKLKNLAKYSPTLFLNKPTAPQA